MSAISDGAFVKLITVDQAFILYRATKEKIEKSIMNAVIQSKLMQSHSFQTFGAFCKRLAKQGYRIY